MPAPLRNDEFAAFAELAKARRRLVVNMFTGTQLKFGLSQLNKDRKGLAKDKKSLQDSVQPLIDMGKDAAKTAATKAVKKAAPGLVEVYAAVKDFILQCTDVPGLDELAEAIGAEAVANLIGEAVPYISIAYSSGKLAKATALVARDGHNLYKSRTCVTGFRSGDPLKAAEAVQTIIKRDLARNSANAGLQTVSTSLKVAGLFADFGTGTTVGVGVASAIASLGLKLAALGVDVNDLLAGNKRLARPDTLDITVVEECPILGCYLLTCADTSQVADLFLADIGLPGWKERVEVLKAKKLDPLLDIAARAIRVSRLQLDGLSSNKGIYMSKGHFAQVKSMALKHARAH